ncbi:hypothetical protein ERO13_A12G200100v2 [Gossypium hirsutum]|uniref:Probable aspartic protease At2g35615 n=1 Tax=Gossypium hirsutum TaxID=3635 RepID=A0A1U8M2Z6_GOSHI|nr:probable aspartic protease At2g35615 [Gossypium hirsutum]KAG4171285.1 hypothetical protein ERO13_A12G200100v2 [Gossypium hirsutum]
MASTFGNCSVLSSVVLLIMCICLTQWLLVFPVAKTIPNGFSVDLIHRDSPLSPLYSPLETPFVRFYNAYNRSISRINRFRPSYSEAVWSDIMASGGEYFMNISIGTPPVLVLGIADTGSDLTWVQCKPCEECYRQKPPLFDPMKSSTYKSVQCGSGPCNALDSSDRVCDQEQNTCKYSYSYGDRSFTRGNVALEKFTIGAANSTRIDSPVSFPNLVFGCGHKNGGTFDDVGSGIIGLGGGPLSLVKQLSKSIHGKFSYCLQAPDSAAKSSKLIFGTATDSNVVSTSTPLVDRDPSTYYYVTLEAISVGDKKLAYGRGSASSATEEGNIIIDSGTTLTFLESEFYNSLESALEEAIEAKRVSDPKGLLSPCFEADKDMDLPIITFHFSGADVKLQPWNTFAQVQDHMVCFTIVPSNDIAIFGNLSQMDFLVSYDLEERSVSFTPTDCPKNH